MAANVPGLGNHLRLPKAMDTEREFLSGVVGSRHADGEAPWEEIVNLYVSLKTKPLLLLVGPPGTGKRAAAEKVARVLAGGDAVRYQSMLGHAWWAEGSSQLGTFTQLQTRFNTLKIFSLMEEACQPDNGNQFFVGLLYRVSLAEVEGYFSRLASQITEGDVQQLPSGRNQGPLPYPPNLRLIGTVDVPNYSWIDDPSLLSQTTIVHWDKDEKSCPSRDGLKRTLYPEAYFLHSSILSGTLAYWKLRSLPGWRPAHLRELLELESMLIKNGIDLPTAQVTNEILIYLANAWSIEKEGLFSSMFDCNHTVALDLAIAQSILPRIWKSINTSEKLQQQLMECLVGRFPRSLCLLEYWV
ncbi:MAG: hypothetical protein R6U57_01005 [Anaerolineales bacterium]